MSDPIEIQNSEFDGFFLEIQFDGESDTTLLFVAEKDFQSLKQMAGKEETSWEDLRNEIMELLDHSGHDTEHELGEETVESIRDAIIDW